MQNNKSWVEIVMMPLAVTLVGTVGTYFLTRQQLRSSEIASQAQIESSENLARSDQQIKVLEIFSEKITSDNVRERELAVRILQSVDPVLAEKLAKAIAETETENVGVRKLAQKIADSEASKGYSFPVIGSFETMPEAIDFIKTINPAPYTPEIYLSDNNYYAVTLGGYLRKEEAATRVRFAQQQGIAPDAFVKNTRTWGENLYR